MNWCISSYSVNSLQTFTTTYAKLCQRFTERERERDSKRALTNEIHIKRAYPVVKLQCPSIFQIIYCGHSSQLPCSSINYVLMLLHIKCLFQKGEVAIDFQKRAERSFKSWITSCSSIVQQESLITLKIFLFPFRRLACLDFVLALLPVTTAISNFGLEFLPFLLLCSGHLLEIFNFLFLQIVGLE